MGGYVDAVGFLTLFGLFTAHQSGNTTHGAVELGLGHWEVSWAYYGLAVRAATAMGLQASALRRIGELQVNTAFVTGMLVSVAEDGVRGWQSHRAGDASAAREFWALLLPIAALAALVSLRRPTPGTGG